MSKPKKSEERAIKKTITVFPRHQQFIDENTLNLSKFVQKKIDEESERKRRN
jgi:hypothetical protein